MKCVVANGIVPFLEISHNLRKNGCLIHYLFWHDADGIAEFWPERSTSLNSQAASAGCGAASYGIKVRNSPIATISLKSQLA